jgi:hypothetical protein
MTASQLIEILKSYPPEAEVVALWDGGYSKIKTHELDGIKRRGEGEYEDVVVLDVSDHGSYYW